MDALRRLAFRHGSDWARTFGMKGVALRLLEAGVREYPADASLLASLGFAYAQEGRNREALAAFDRAGAADPADAEIQFNRGFLQQALNNHEAAIDTFRHTIEMKPDHDRALYGLALSLISLRRLDEAVPLLERNTKLQPLSPYGWYQLGRVQFDRGKPDKTEAIIAKLQTFEPKVAAQLARDTGLPMPRP